MNDPRERDLWFETQSRTQDEPAPRRFTNRLLALLVGLVVVPVLVYLALRLT